MRGITRLASPCLALCFGLGSLACGARPPGQTPAPARQPAETRAASHDETGPTQRRARSEPPGQTSVFDRLTEALESAGVTSLFRMDGMEDPGVLSAISGVDHDGAFLCIEEALLPTCVTVGGAGRPSAIDGGRDYGPDGVRLSYTDDAGGRVTIRWLRGRVPTASVTPARMSGGASHPLPAPEPRPAPAYLSLLRDLDIYSDDVAIVVVARLDCLIVVCFPSRGYASAPPLRLVELGHQSITLEDAFVMDGTVSVDFEWRDEAADGEGLGRTTIWLDERDEPASLTLLATVVTYLEQRTRIDDDTEEVIEMEILDAAEMPTGRCLEVGESTGRRFSVDAMGGEHDVVRTRFREAPATVASTGLTDPLHVSMQGAWNVSPAGSMQKRTRPCPEL